MDMLYFSPFSLTQRPDVPGPVVGRDSVPAAQLRHSLLPVQGGLRPLHRAHHHQLLLRARALHREVPDVRPLPG